MKKKFGFYEELRVSPSLFFVSSALIAALVGAYFFPFFEIVSHEPLSPEVKQEIREAVKDGIQASRDQELQQLREVQNPPASPRNIHF